jgi:cholesterol oxidase
MRRLSSSPEALGEHVEIIVIGSGYGGAIAASRLARAGRQVAVLERGREFMPGEFPATALQGVEQIQYNTTFGHLGSRLALVEVHVNDDMQAVVGCGLGGTSLINANVALEVDPRIWDDERWPAAVRADRDGGIALGYRRATHMLDPRPWPDDFPPLPKLEALQASAQALGASSAFRRAPITVTFRNGPNRAGIEQKACIGCGDCNSGCNHLAKNTTQMNYLPDAVAHGAKVFTCIDARAVTRDGERWRVAYQLVGVGRELFDAPELSISADIVIISAGAIGSPGVLLRSREHGLTLSDRLGERFSGNGDILAFDFNTDRTINGIGAGTRPVRANGHPCADEQAIDPVGPCITGIIDQRDPQQPVRDGYVIEEGSLAAPVGAAMLGVLASAVGGVTVQPGVTQAVRQAARIAEGVLRGPYYGAMHNTQTFLVMSHDDEGGRVTLDDDGHTRIVWPHAGVQPQLQSINDTLIAASAPLGGVFVANPIWGPLVGKMAGRRATNGDERPLIGKLVTVHPLGGCAMADDATQGVVDERGRVFRDAHGTAVHSGLYVMDGAVMPMSLGVNPLLTISALAERNTALIAADRGWTIDYSPTPPLPDSSTQTIGFRFTETMSGTYVPAGATPSDGVPMSFALTVATDDLDTMLASSDHGARMAGTLSCPALSSQTMTITDGRFNLFIQDPINVDARNMVYRMRLERVDDTPLEFFGEKIVTESSLLNAWPQTTTLNVKISACGDAESTSTATPPLLGNAVLHIHPLDQLRQLRTMEITGAPDTATRLSALLRFGKFFAGVLFEEYGDIAARLDPAAKPRIRRELRAPLPAVHPFDTPDGVTLRLMRYQGGDKGTILLVHGSGASSRIFSTDLVDTNLVEYLCAHGYDVWTVDLRISIALPSAALPCNADTIATHDVRGAISTVRKLSGAESIQVVGHCFGALVTTMAMLSGVEGVRSIVLSQVSAHPHVGVLQWLKCQLHMPNLLADIGIRDLSADAERPRTWRDRLLDQVLRLYPKGRGEQCTSATCHRATFMFGLPYRHAQLNEQLHTNLHELFGMHNVMLFEHLALIVRRGHLVDAHGNEVYMPYLHRMALPIAFIHGADNRCYLPSSTEKTYRVLCEANGAHWYTRTVVPAYGHIDCIFGRNALKDVYPAIASHLART